MKILPGTSATDLGIKVAHNLKLPLLELKFKYFNDGETYLKINGSFKKEEILLIQNTSPPQEKNLIELLLIASTLKELGAKEVHSIVPYLSFARSDRRRLEGEVTAHQITLDLIYKSGIDSLVTINVHNPDIFLRPSNKLKTHNIDVTKLLIPKLQKNKDKDWYIIGPDKGSYEDVKNIAQELSKPFTILDKYRDPTTHNVSIKDTGFDCKEKDVVLVDDIITSGETVFDAINIINQKNPSSIIYFVVHALSEKETFDKMKKIGVSDIISTNTIPRTDVEQLDITSYLTEYIGKIFL